MSDEPTADSAEALTVRYFARMKRGYGNVMWPGRFAMRGGKFPSNHPCAQTPKPTVSGYYRTKRRGETEYTHVAGEQPESDDPLGRFRARRYWASCFPEGDGFCFDPLNSQSSEQVVRDIEECFGWKVKVQRV